MKRKYIPLFILLLSIASISYSQDVKVKAGIKGGADIHKITGKSFSEQFTFGYHLGGYVSIDLSEEWGIQPELIFSQINVDTGSNFKSLYPQFNSITKVKLSYLALPLLLYYKPNKFVAFQLGPQVGILMDQNSNLLTNGKNAFRKGDFSMVGGLQLSISKISLYGRYIVGLNNINDIDDKEKWKNQSVQLGIGLRL